MLNFLIVALVVLVLAVIAIFAMSGMKHAFRRLSAATIAFVFVFGFCFVGTSLVTGAAPSVEEIPDEVRRPGFWVENWAGIGIGLVSASVLARAMLSRRV